jgi:hypothetical protein
VEVKCNIDGYFVVGRLLHRHHLVHQKNYYLQFRMPYVFEGLVMVI